MMQRGYTDIPEGQIHFMTAGEGETLLLLHPTPWSSRMYEKILPLLARQYHVIAIDTLGAGNSSPLPPDVRIEDLAQSMVHFLDALHIERSHVFGIHTGATIAAEVAARWPSRMGNLILLGYPLLEPGEERETVLLKQVPKMDQLVKPSADGSHLHRQWDWSYKQIIHMWWDTQTPPPRSLSPDHIHFLSQCMMDLGQSKDGAPMLYRAVFTYDAQAQLPLIQARTLLIDAMSNYEADFCQRGEVIQRLIPNSTHLKMHAADANAPQWQTNELAEIMANFLSQGHL